MALGSLRVYAEFCKLLAVFFVRRLSERVQAIIHRHTYHPSQNPKTVLVVGGSFAGVLLAQRLANTLPSGYRVILLEKHSHLHFAFAFPRFSVESGLEHRAFIPYGNLAAGAPKGAFEHVHGEAKEVDDGSATLTNGKKIEYDFLAIATGAAQPPPTRLHSSTKEGGIAELKGYQQRITEAHDIAVIGGGAAGVELVTDIRHKYPEKRLTLIHSRQELLPRFGHKLHEYVINALKRMDIEVVLGQRPELPDNIGESLKKTTMKISTGDERIFDLIIPCTGLRPQSELIAQIAPMSIAPNGEILVDSTLQVRDASKKKIFALGDVARTGGPKQARACIMQAEIVTTNIVRLIKSHGKLTNYVPHPYENALQLTLGKEGQVLYLQMGDFEWLKTSKGWSDDVGAPKMWQILNAKME